jgi:hypothetical protein
VSASACEIIKAQRLRRKIKKNVLLSLYGCHRQAHQVLL